MTATTTRPRPPITQRPVQPSVDTSAAQPRGRVGRAERRLRASVQHELDAVTRSLRTPTGRARPSAVPFALAALLTVVAVVLLTGAAVVGLAALVPLWLAAVLVGSGLLAAAAAMAAWGHTMLPEADVVLPVAPITHPAEELVHPWVD